jgi:septum formation protein
MGYDVSSASTGKHSRSEQANDYMELILASASPRRAEILRDAGFAFETAHANVDERRRGDEMGRAMTRRLAEAKARQVAERLRGELGNAIVIGADTTVELRGRLLGKPESASDARRMLEMLRGRTHRVITSVAAIRIPDHVLRIGTETTRVQFADMSAAEIADYVSSREPLDKAGGYGVQGIGGRFVSRIEGCYFNVVGLPLARLYRILLDLGWKPSRHAVRKPQL